LPLFNLAATHLIKGNLKKPHFATAILLSFSIAACALLTQPNCQSGEELALQNLLYFGTGKNSGFVTQTEWEGFLESTVTPRFPQGLTVFDATGQWQGVNGMTVKEPSNVLTLIHSDDTASEQAVRDIIQTYKQRFQQEAVLRVKRTVCISY
jgi:hypothetical protein